MTGLAELYRKGLRRLRGLAEPALGALRQHPPRPLVVPRHYARPLRLAAPPLISVVTPSFNQGDFLEQTLCSVLRQRYPRLEYFVQDGGSSDGTLAVLEGYKGRLHHCASGPDKGQAHALNLGFGRAGGEVLAYLNSDDLLLPGCLGYVARYFAHHPEVDVVYGHRVLIDEQGDEVGRWVLPPHCDEALLWKDFVPQETLFWRRRIWERVGGRLDEGLQFALDWDLLLRFRAAGARFARLPRFLAAFRVHARQKTSTLPEVGRREVAQLLRRWHGREVSEQEVEARVQPYVRRHLLYHKLYRLGVLDY